MLSGEVNVIVFPETEAISLISLVGLSVRENHDMAAGGTPGVVSYGPDTLELSLSSWNFCCGKCMFQATTSPCHTCGGQGVGTRLFVQPKPTGTACQEAPEVSSSRTNCPAANPVALAIVTEDAPCWPSAVRF